MSAIVARDLEGAKGAALVDTLLIVGILAAVLMSDRVGRIRLQVLGFLGCAAGLAMAALQSHMEEPARTMLLFGGFMLFNFRPTSDRMRRPTCWPARSSRPISAARAQASPRPSPRWARS